MKLVGERRAISSIVFALFFLLFALNAFLNSGGPFAKMLWGLAFTYGIAFFSLVAGYFWARWYAMGVGLFGVFLSVLGMWMGRNDPNVEMTMLIVQFSLHGAAAVCLWGEGMAAAYDGKTAWREKFHMDDNAVNRLGRSVIRAGMSLPLVLAYAFAPKQPTDVAIGIAALVCAGLGMRALIKMKTWGVLALAASGAMMVGMGIEHTQLFPMLSGALLLSAAAPFALPMLRFARA
jgi:hypothetical protein